jgi:NAD(P)-dependent dehydrogenase (short-subunit alcohol dehydrogenase family)
MGSVSSGRVASKVVVVTGSTMGIGEGIARLLAAEGASVVVSGRNRDLGERVAGEITASRGNALFVQADIAQPPDCSKLIETAAKHFGRIDSLVNNAAIYPQVNIEDQTPELWDQVYNVNIRGAFLCTQAAIPYLRQQGGGTIVNVGSTLAYRSSADRLPYACSKGALLTMTKVLAKALLKDRILVNFVIVGWVATPGEVELRNQTHGDGMRYLEQRSDEAPLGRLETVEDIAQGVLYLVSDAASHVTGCELNISGGLLV